MFAFKHKGDLLQPQVASNRSIAQQGSDAMGFKVKTQSVTVVSVLPLKKYVAGVRLKVGFSDGEVLFFREVRKGSQVWDLMMILDTELSSPKIVKELFQPQPSRRGPGADDPQYAVDTAIPLLEDVLETDEAMGPSATYFYLDRDIRFDGGEPIVIGGELRVWRSSLFSSGGAGFEIEGRKIASVKVAKVKGAP